jgi:hypothetical protein
MMEKGIGLDCWYCVKDQNYREHTLVEGQRMVLLCHYLFISILSFSCGVFRSLRRICNPPVSLFLSLLAMEKGLLKVCY